MAVDWEADPAPARYKPERVEIRTFDQALAWGDGWVRAHHLLQNAYDDMAWERDYYRGLLGYLDPFLPRWLQDEKLRAANEEIYAVLAESRGDTL